MCIELEAMQATACASNVNMSLLAADPMTLELKCFRDISFHVHIVKYAALDRVVTAKHDTPVKLNRLFIVYGKDEISIQMVRRWQNQ